MVHPTFKAAGTRAAAGADAGVLDHRQPAAAVLRREVRSGLARAAARRDAARRRSRRAALLGLRDALPFLHHPTPDVALATLEDHSHPAWQRLKFEELLAQQLSQLQAQRERAAQRAPALARRAPAALHEQLLAALPFALTGAQQRVGEEIARDLARDDPDAPAAAGRRRLRQDRGRRARGRASPSTPAGSAR